MKAADDDRRHLATVLGEAAELARTYADRDVDVVRKAGGSPVTEADHALDAFLRQSLPRPGEGWLSEESADDLERLDRRRVWIVDPIDGTEDFIARTDEWSISVGLIEDGRAILGGIANPRQRRLVVGGPELGIEVDGRAIGPIPQRPLQESVVLASRNELRRREWARFEQEPFRIRPVSSIAWKMALVAIGEADATWALGEKSEWDVAAGCALAAAAGRRVCHADGSTPRFNRPSPLVRGIVVVPDPSRAEGWAGFLGRLV